MPMSKSGKARHVPSSDSLELLLNSIPKVCEWVFANPGRSKQLSAVNEITRAAPNILGEGSRPQHLPDITKAQVLRASRKAKTAREPSRKACPHELEMIARAEALRVGIAF
jgi:hypothetical protein